MLFQCEFFFFFGKLIPKTNYVCFFPGREWAAVSTEGLLIYSLDANMTFDPFELELDITPDNIRMEAKVSVAKKCCDYYPINLYLYFCCRKKITRKQ